ncbi:MAG: hypothetical protein ACFCVD_05695 [Nodosilinea sp.]
MPVTKETLKQEIDCLDNAQLNQLAEYIAFLKFRRQLPQRSADLAKFALLYKESAQEDRRLAESGLAEYISQLNLEDHL